ncbi:MAG: Dam family site-specific DNA-(adenine-N6)-methyltransferase [Clostridiales bacterium]|nr:Dam family site-specific DNA-(adenine-N6)-methyltransferase [Clostridiales bacterium]
MLGAKPFIKWAGGKGQLLEKFESLYPRGLKDGKIDMYVEPFVGGGAVLFAVLQKYDVKRAVIFDVNKELINCYGCIKNRLSGVLCELAAINDGYNASADKEAFFYEVRNDYNKIKLNGRFDEVKAARFIFLNKTCFNGLYRVNGGGGFNVPFGRYKNPNITDKKNLTAVSDILQRVEIFHGDYGLCRNFLNDKAFVYFDPPYRPVTETGKFVGYSKDGFNDGDQIALSEFVGQIDQTGCKIMLSNSDPKNNDINDNFFDRLYEGFYIDRIRAKRVINCQAAKRGDITEIVVRNYRGENPNDN